MSDYVEKTDLYGTIRKKVNNPAIRSWLGAIIAEQPAADAVPVVRCKDCKYRTWFAPYYGCGNFESPFYVAVDKDVAIMTKPDDYCSYGERRAKYDAVRAIAENEV